MKRSEVVKVKNKGIDKVLAELWRQHIVEHTPEALKRDDQIVMRAMDIAESTNDPDIKIKAWSLVHKIHVETYYSRTIPTLQSVRIRSEIDTTDRGRYSDVDWSEAHRRALEVIAGEKSQLNGGVH